MAEQLVQEREYTIPLRKKLIKKSRYIRTGIAIKLIRQFIAKHMKIPERDTKKVRIDPYLNNDVWFRGIANPPSKVKVKATREGDIVKVTFAEMPEIVKFEKAKHDRRNKPLDSKEKPEQKVEEPKEETKEETKDEKEKEQSVADSREKQAEQQSKAQKHVKRAKEPSYHRLAMRK